MPPSHIWLPGSPFANWAKSFDSYTLYPQCTSPSLRVGLIKLADMREEWLAMAQPTCRARQAHLPHTDIIFPELLQQLPVPGTKESLHLLYSSCGCLHRRRAWPCYSPPLNFVLGGSFHYTKEICSHKKNKKKKILYCREAALKSDLQNSRLIYVLLMV